MCVITNSSRRRALLDAAQQAGRRLLGAAIDEHAMADVRVTVFDPERVAVACGKHLDVEERALVT
jgi:hypothetical protein